MCRKSSAPVAIGMLQCVHTMMVKGWHPTLIFVALNLWLAVGVWKVLTLREMTIWDGRASVSGYYDMSGMFSVRAVLWLALGAVLLAIRWLQAVRRTQRKTEGH
jgi:hypothetical protein